MEVTRRSLARMLAATAAVPLEAVAQTSPEQDLAKEREELKDNARELAKVSLPMATEPAFRFKA